MRTTNSHTPLQHHSLPARPAGRATGCLRALGIVAAGWAVSVAAAAGPQAPAHRWISLPLTFPQPQAYFTNLRDGDRIETPYVVKFGLSRHGLSPIVKDVPRTGHHHLLINRELPLDFDKPLPFNDQYMHFGKGEMQTVLTLPPGSYKLRLLLADHRHVPYFIYSKPATITVTRKNEAIDPKGLVKPGVSLLSPRSGDTVQAPFRVQFHASGFGVAHAAVKDVRFGHFRLVAERPGQAAESIDFTDGATEAWLSPPPGDYTFRLQFVHNSDLAEVADTTPAISVKVVPHAAAP